MATRFFLTNDSTAPAVSPTISATDWLHVNTARRKLLLTADSSTLTSTAYTPDAGDDLVIGNAHHCQFVSDPLGAQTIVSSSTVRAQLQTLEAHINNNLALTLKVYTVDSTGAFKSALLAVIGKGTEPTASLRNTSFTATALGASGGNVAVAEGDRLVVEIGLGGTPSATSGTQGHNGTIRWGCSAGSGDLPVDETQTGTTYRPWVEFSADLAFLKTYTNSDALGSYADAFSQAGTTTPANARGFGATLGVASTDRIQTALTSHADQRTYAIWAYPRSIGANASMMDKSNTGVQFERLQDSSDGTLTYQYKRTWSGGIAQWGAARPSNAVWTHVVVTYDASSSGNAPSIYYNGVSQSVTTQVGASGTLSSNADSYWIGNRGNGDRGWDGKLAEFAVWDRILSAAEILDLATGVGSYNGKSPLFYPTGLVEYIALNDTPVTSEILANPTTTGTAVQTGLAIQYPSPAPPNLTVTPDPDPLGSYADQLTKELRTPSGWNDQLTVSFTGTTPIAVNLPADSLAGYADTPTVLLTGALTGVLTDSLGTYADQAPTIREGLLVAPGADSLGLYADQAPTIFFSVAAGLSDSLGLYADQAPTIREGLLVAPADSLPAYTDSANGFFTFAAAQTDALNQWADQRNVSTGAAFISIQPPADSLNNWLDAPTSAFTAALSVSLSDSLNSWADTPTVSLIGFRSASFSDALHNWVDNLAGFVALRVLPGAEAMTPADQIGAMRTMAATLTDARPAISDQLGASTGGGQSVSFSDSLNNWLDQVGSTGRRSGWSDSVAAVTANVRVGWTDSLAATVSSSSARTVNLPDARPIPVDTISQQYGYHFGTVIYLVDPFGNYIVDENGNRIIVSGLIDNLQQGDSVAITRTAAGTTPRLVALTDPLPVHVDALQVTRGVIPFDLPFSEALGSYSDTLLFVDYVGLLTASLTDALPVYNDSSPVMSTSGEQWVTLSDAIPNPADSIQITRTGFTDYSILLTDALGGYADADLFVTTSGELRAVPPDDPLDNYTDAPQTQRTGALSVGLSDTLANYADQPSITYGILKTASDNLAGYTDSPTHGRGLFYGLTDGLANYLDLMTAGGTGQRQVALSDNLGQYSDGLPATFANFAAQPPADNLAAYTDAPLGIVLAKAYPLNDSLALDDLFDVRLGEFNELRFELTDGSFNHWADAATFARVFLAIKLSGKIIEQVNVSGKLHDERVSLTGEFYTGDP